MLSRLYVLIMKFLKAHMRGLRGICAFLYVLIMKHLTAHMRGRSPRRMRSSFSYWLCHLFPVTCKSFFLSAQAKASFHAAAKKSFYKPLVLLQLVFSFFLLAWQLRWLPWFRVIILKNHRACVIHFCRHYFLTARWYGELPSVSGLAWVFAKSR